MKKQSKTNWDRIDTEADDAIAYSDNAELAPSFFKEAVHWPGHKELISPAL